jgi:hypothetical protein
MSITAHEMYNLADELREFAISLVDKGIVKYIGDRKACLTLGSTLRVDGQYYVVDRSGKEVIVMNYYTDQNDEQKVAAALNFANLYDPYETKPSTLPTGEDVYWGQDMYVVIKHVDCSFYDRPVVLLSKYNPFGSLIGCRVIPKSDVRHEVEIAFNYGELK